MLMALLGFMAVFLTFTMFHSRNMMMGFPCVIFWAVLGGHAYGESTITWDIYYFLFFAGMGMAIFSALAMYGLREKRDTIGDEEMERGEDGYIDEKLELKISGMKEPQFSDGEDNLEIDTVSPRRKALHDRAGKRKTNWDEFK